MTALIIIIFVFSVLLHLPLYITIQYDNNACITVKLLMFTIFKSGDRKKPLMEDETTESEESSPEKKASILKGQFSLLKEIVFEMFRHLRKYIVILNVSISYTFGFSDAAATGIFSGVAHAVINAFMAGIDHTFKVRDIDINITPDFNKPVHSINTSLKVRILVVHIFIILFNLVKISLKNNSKTKKAVD